MKAKHAALLAIIGLLLTIFPSILNFLIPYNKISLIYSFMLIAGNILLGIFFYVYFIKQQDNNELKTAGIFGFAGYVINIFVNIEGIIYKIILEMALRKPSSYMKLIPFASMINTLNIFISLISIVLIIICFAILYKNFNKEDTLRRAALIALIGQCGKLLTSITGYIYYGIIFPRIYQKMSTGDIYTIDIIENVIALIPTVLIMYLFITLYRVNVIPVENTEA